MVLGELGKEFFKRGERHEEKDDERDSSNIDERFFEAFFKDSDEVKFAIECDKNAYM